MCDALSVRSPEDEQRITQDGPNGGKNDFILILKPFSMVEAQEPTVKSLDEWQQSRARAECLAMDARADSLVSLFRESQCAHSRLVEAIFAWEGEEDNICLLLEVSGLWGNQDVRIIRHVARI